jgi:hypothetical protein
MTGKPDNPYAFPTFNESGFAIHAGMTLRDYFAAAAMNGLLANGRPVTINNGPTMGIDVAAYEMADCMLKAREPKSEAQP